MNPQWSLKGDYLESCNCKGACPCIYLGSPTEGECTALVGWHITQGQFEAVDLGDRNVAIALHSPAPWPRETGKSCCISTSGQTRPNRKR